MENSQSSTTDSLPVVGTTTMGDHPDNRNEPPQEQQQPPRQQGIDIHQALSILSERSGQSSESRHDGCDCCHGSQVPDDAKWMGQTIDLLAPSQPQSLESESRVLPDETRLHQERTERLDKIRQQLHSMTDRELLQAVMKAQQDRVTTYRDYERGLKVVLQTGNLTSYPDTCSKVTASFSVLSETIKSIHDIITSRPRHNTNDESNDWAQLIQRLQQQEKEKLHLTAAHHLERIRQRNQQLQVDADPRIENLFQEGVNSLQIKIHHCVEQINEIMEEIQCAILDAE